MANKGTYTARLTLVDDFTGKLAKINKSMAAMQAPAKRLNAQWQRFGKLSGISKVTEGVKNLTGSIAKAGIAMTGLGAAASLAGMYALIKSSAEAGFNLDMMSRNLGVNANKLSGMQNAAAMAGISIDQLNSGIEASQDVIQQAFTGRNVTALRIFTMLGVKAGDSWQSVHDKVRAAYRAMLANPKVSASTRRQFLQETGFAYDTNEMNESDSDLAKDKAMGAKYAIPQTTLDKLTILSVCPITP